METDDLTHPVTNDEILRKVVQMRADGVGGSANFYDRMRKAEDFVIGEQWDPAVKEAARLDGKFTLTIPIVKSQIKQLTGSEVQNPQDFIIKNTRGGAAAVAKILTALTKQAADSERIRYEKSQAFESGLSSGQGAIGVFIDKTDDPKHANLRIEKLNEHNTMVDPNCTTYNPNKLSGGAKYVIWEEWVDKEFVEAEYPDDKEDLEGKGSQSFLEITAGNIRGIIDWMTGRRSTRETGAFGARERTDITVMRKNRYLKSHTWWREPKTCLHWYDKRESELESVFLCRDKDIALARKATKTFEEAARVSKETAISLVRAAGKDLRDPKVIAAIEEAGEPIFSIEEVTSYVMHHTIRVGDTFLEDRVDELNGVQMFPLNFYWPYWINGYKSGVSEDLIGTQEEINWTHSMAMNLIKKLANKSFKIKGDQTHLFTQWLKDHAGDNNLVIDESRGDGKVDVIEENPFPAQIFEMFTQSAMENARTITGVRTEMPEKDTKALSGRAIFLKKQTEVQGSMSLMNNWYYTLAIFGDLVVDIIRKNDIFSEDEIREIVDKDDLFDEEILDQAKGIIINQIQQQGGQILQQPQSPNPIRMSQAEPELQAQMLETFQAEMALYQQFVEQVEEAAKPIAEQILISLIHNMKSGKYSTKVITSPMSETMRAIKALETFELQKLLIESADVGLDGEDLIDVTDVPNKEKLKLGRQKKMETLVGAGVA